MPLRADARANRAALLTSAARLFTDQGPDVALDAIARDAGVSIATLYRHFPSREALIAEAYGAEIAALGEVDLAEGTAADALTRWLARFVEYARTKRALGDLVHALPEGSSPPAREVIVDALERILAAGARDGSLTTDQDAQDVLALLAGLWTLPDGPEWPARAGRLARFVVAGLKSSDSLTGQPPL
ncbi:TetR/AcrR family transcriptional regulator; helix-turn-helix transcriptional regulator [Actinomycetospora endophytica]|uniref:TetR/AcrR family transcriptional regulator helix-turn-helix transcriptional regulator n=1 Tax=Actinomycetospora endophytica TaxID=2291215 RepID=A0ABS8P618_9PSEU|nr:TetR/AcrR family transcriptional regulator [Actinomycetospora endophytica]MCD2193710.1 TetR/AcrR family transcriptional regulator; helix-turn-helix transcriptional regulator [Actinomycetospora endophytica]